MIARILRINLLLEYPLILIIPFDSLFGQLPYQCRVALACDWVAPGKNERSCQQCSREQAGENPDGQDHFAGLHRQRLPGLGGDIAAAR
jgi:hypothetical protein